MRPMTSTGTGHTAAGAGDPHAARLDANGIVQPCANLVAHMARGEQSVRAVAMDQAMSSPYNERSQARAQALQHLADFYAMRRDPKSNEDYLTAAALGSMGPRDRSALRRQNSFVSIMRPLIDVQKLAFTPEGEPDPYMDSDTVDVVEEILKAVQCMPAALQEAAIVRAKAGERKMPLSIDQVRMRNFLADQEARMAEVVAACAGGVGNPARLEAPIKALAAEYLRRTGQLPTGLAPGTHVDFRDVQLSSEPISILVDRYPGSEHEYLGETDGNRDKLVISLGKNDVSGPLERHVRDIGAFQSKSPAQQRAAVILLTLFTNLTLAEERIHTTLRRVNNATDRQQALGTKNEWEYVGSLRIGDAINVPAGHPSQRSQRTHTALPLRILANVQTNRKAEGNWLPIRHPDLSQWLTSARFDMDMQDICLPMWRLANAQSPYTAEALLSSRAFGGPGLR